MIKIKDEHTRQRTVFNDGKQLETIVQSLRSDQPNKKKQKNEMFCPGN